MLNLCLTIFDLFSQAERALDRVDGGLGIGLAVVKGIVELHKGSVLHPARASEGRGVRGTSTAEGGTSAHEHVAERPGPPAVPQRILIVDDNADLAESMAMLLRFEGHQVRVARDGSSALELAEEFRPNAALLDIGLPGLNGYELAREFRSRQKGRGLLLIAATAMDSPRTGSRTGRWLRLSYGQTAGSADRWCRNSQMARERWDQRQVRSELLVDHSIMSIVGAGSPATG